VVIFKKTAGLKRREQLLKANNIHDISQFFKKKIWWVYAIDYFILLFEKDNLACIYNYISS